MNKKYLIIIFTFFMFLFLSDDVYASNFCAYGIRDSDGKNWEKRITFEVISWNTLNIDGSSEGTPFFDWISWAEGKEPHKVDGEEYLFSGQDSSAMGGHYYFYVSLYPFEETYEELEGDCPPTIKYQIKSEGGTYDKHRFLFFNDDLDKPIPTNHWWLGDWDNSAYDKEYLKKIGFRGKDEGVLILEKYKDEPLENLIDEYDCFSYTTGMNAIKKSVQDSESKSCDNNIKFNSTYQTLQSRCENFRATALYAEDKDDQVLAKACSKACSMLNDDISKVCDPDGSESPQGCKSLGGKVVSWIFKIIRFVRYAVPVLLIILSVLDYIKALASDSEDEMKKVTSRFVKRLIAAALIFIIPFILDFLLRVFNIPNLSTENPFCAN